MSRANQINLLKTQSPVTPELLDRIALTWKLSLSLTIVVAIAGIISAIIYGALTVQNSTLTQESTRIKKEISLQANKEGIFLSLKQRLGLIKNVRSATIAWKSVLETASAIAAPPILQSVSVEEQNTTLIVVRPQSIEESLLIVNNVVDQARLGKVRDPRLKAFSIGKDGITITFTFFPVL